VTFARFAQTQNAATPATQAITLRNSGTRAVNERDSQVGRLTIAGTDFL
jgi:hypothetical protein